MNSFSFVGSSEPYLFPDGLGSCSGIISDVFIPNNFLSPFIFQKKIESEIRKEFNSLDVWMSNDCYFATRLVSCTSKMLHPQKVSKVSLMKSNNISFSQLQKIVDLENISSINSELYFPSYPSQDICIDYYNKCGSYLHTFNKTSSVLGKYTSIVVQLMNLAFNYSPLATKLFFLLTHRRRLSV